MVVPEGVHPQGGGRTLLAQAGRKPANGPCGERSRDPEMQTTQVYAAFGRGALQAACVAGRVCAAGIPPNTRV